MASPVAHSFAGLWTFLLLVQRVKVRAKWLKRAGQFCLLVLVANLADFDFLPEILFKKDIHRGFSHSLLAAFLAAVLFAAIWRIARSFWASAGIYFIAYASHLVIDFFTGLELGWNHTGSGVPFFWPWPKKDFGSLLVLDYGIRHGSLEAIFSLANLRAICYDMCLYGTLTAALLLWRARYLLKQTNSRAQYSNAQCLLHQRAADPK